MRRIKNHWQFIFLTNSHSHFIIWYIAHFKWIIKTMRSKSSVAEQKIFLINTAIKYMLNNPLPVIFAFPGLVFYQKKYSFILRGNLRNFFLEKMILIAGTDPNQYFSVAGSIQYCFNHFLSMLLHDNF